MTFSIFLFFFFFHPLDKKFNRFKYSTLIHSVLSTSLFIIICLSISHIYFNKHHMWNRQMIYALACIHVWYVYMWDEYSWGKHIIFDITIRDESVSTTKIQIIIKSSILSRCIVERSKIHIEHRIIVRSIANQFSDPTATVHFISSRNALTKILFFDFASSSSFIFFLSFFFFF